MFARGITVLVLATALLAGMVVSCDGGPPPPWPPETRLGPPTEANISEIEIADSVSVNEPQTVIASFHPYGRWELASETVEVDESSKTVTIKILIREESYWWGPGVCRASQLYDGHGAVRRSFEVTFPTLGRWKVVCNRLSAETVVRGEWLDETRLPRIEEFELPAAVIVGKEAQLRITILHENGEWFYRDVEQELDEEAMTLALAVCEGRAESALPDEPWSEDVEIPLVLPALGRWTISLPNGDFMVRYVQPEPPPTEYGPGEYWCGSPSYPRNLLTPDEVHAGEPASCTVVLELREPYEEFGGVDLRFDTANRALYGKAWAFHQYVEGAESTAEFREELSLIFPEAGQWFIVFSGGGSEPFIRVLKVLPAEE